MFRAVFHFRFTLCAVVVLAMFVNSPIAYGQDSSQQALRPAANPGGGERFGLADPSNQPLQYRSNLCEK
jgi:hypothetical protein